MKRKSSNRAWRHSTSSTKTGLAPPGPGSGPSPLAVPVASSRAWEGKAVPVLRARRRSAAMPIRPRLVPSGQRTSKFGKAIGSERVGTSKVAAYASATRIATVPRYWSSGTGKNEEIPSLRLSTSFKAQIEPKGLFRQQQTKLRAPERRPLLPRIAYACGHERRPSGSNSAYRRRSSRPHMHRNSERNPPIWGVARH
jgi:hypothetical protein